MRSALNAAWRIKWGAGSEERVMVCDLRTARYCLGACTRVTVEALRWQDTINADGTAFDIVASGAVVPAGGSQGDEPTVTIVNSYETNDEVSERIVIPNCARWFVPLLDARTPNGSVWGSTQPDFKFSGFGEAVLISPANSTITPAKHRYEVSAPWFDSNAPAPVGSVETSPMQLTPLTDDLQLGVRFYLAI